jgi:hypothetical protein
MDTCFPSAIRRLRPSRIAAHAESNHIEQPYDLPDSVEPFGSDKRSDLEEFDLPPKDDADWEVFIPDDDEFDPQPDGRDFWTNPSDEDCTA